MQESQENSKINWAGEKQLKQLLHGENEKQVVMLKAHLYGTVFFTHFLKLWNIGARQASLESNLGR